LTASDTGDANNVWTNESANLYNKLDKKYVTFENDKLSGADFEFSELCLRMISLIENKEQKAKVD